MAQDPETEELLSTRPDRPLAPALVLLAASVPVGLLAPLLGVTLAMLAVLWLLWIGVREATDQGDAAPDQVSDPPATLSLLALMGGMMLSGFGAAWSAMQSPGVGLALSVAGGLICALGVAGVLRRRGPGS